MQEWRLNPMARIESMDNDYGWTKVAPVQLDCDVRVDRGPSNRRHAVMCGDSDGAECRGIRAVDTIFTHKDDSYTKK